MAKAAARKQLGTIVALLQNSPFQPAGPIYQPYGPPAPYSQPEEVLNSIQKWREAFLFANTVDERGFQLSVPYGQEGNAVTVPVTVNGVTTNTRIDLVALAAEDLVGQKDFLKQGVQSSLIESLLPKIEAAEKHVVNEELTASEKRLPKLSGQTGLRDAMTLARRLLELATWAEKRRKELGQAVPEQARIEALLRAVTDHVRELAVARKAWWYVAEYTEILLDAAEDKVFLDAATLKTALTTQGASSLQLARDIATTLGQALPTSRPIDLKLPGDLVVDHVFGELQFRRDTGEFGGSFGGRLRFPEVKAYFDLKKGTVDSNGNFSFQGGLETPTPFDGVRVKGEIRLAGRGRPNPDPARPPVLADQTISIEGAGTVYFPGGKDVATTINYSTETKELAFAISGNDLGLKLGSNVALFGAGAAVTFGGIGVDGVRIDNAELKLAGSVGLLRTDKPPRKTDGPSVEDYELLADNTLIRLRFQPNMISLSLDRGRLQLPEIFTSSLCQPPPGPGQAASTPVVRPGRAALNILANQPLSVSLRLDPAVDANSGPLVRSLELGGALTFTDVGVTVPGLPGLSAQLCRGSLTFPPVVITGAGISAEAMPILNIDEGRAQLPLPPGQTNTVALSEFKWRLDGLPSGTLVLASDMTVFDQGGFSMTVLGGKNCGPESPATGIRVFEASSGDGGNLKPPRIELYGGVRWQVAKGVLKKEAGTGSTQLGEDAEQLNGHACGTLRLEPGQQPMFDLREVQIGGAFRLGATGPRIVGASLTLQNFDRLYNQTPQNPFVAKLDGKLILPGGPGFGLKNARFVFFDNQRLPEFQPGTLEYDQAEWKLAQSLPLQVKSAKFEFLDGSLGFPEIFRPGNVKAKVSARAAIPPENPFIAGEVNDLTVQFDGQGNPSASVSSVSLALDPGLKIPPINDLGGSVFIGGLDQNPPHPFFAGRVSGKYQGTGLKFILAFNLLGPVGLCLDVNAGPAGIPIDGGVLGGFLLTGASGGMSFLNSSGDPCDFTSYVDPVTGKPISNPLSLPPGLPPIPLQAMSWSQLTDFLRRFERAETAYGSGPAVNAATLATPSSMPANPPPDAALSSLSGSGAPAFPCPGDCPPATVNIFCQPHPDQEKFPGRIIAKLTSIDENTLNQVFGITEASIRNLQSQGVNLAVALGRELRLKLDAAIPDPDPAIVGAPRAASIRQLQTEALDALESAYSSLIRERFGDEGNAALLYGVLRDLVYAGLPCPDVSFSVSATFSHAVVSSFISVTGSGTLGTAGSAGVGGTVNIAGIPVGKGKLFVSATDARGLPNPSVCGDVNVALGPLELGWLKAAMKCDDCITAVLRVFGDLIAGLSMEVVENVLTRVAPQFRGRSAQELGSLLSDHQKNAFLIELLQLPAAVLPSDLPQKLVAALGASFSSIDPQILMCGTVNPKLFGIPLAGEAVGVSLQVNKLGRQANLRFSLSKMLGMINAALYVPLGDIASLGYSQAFPDPSQAILAGLSGTLTPARIAELLEQNVLRMLEDSTFTIGYEISPLGFKVGRAQARVINPNLLDHPVLRSPAWRRPEAQGKPSRVELLMAAVNSDRLSNPLWKGNASDLFTVFEDAPRQDQARGLSLINDYFPHGGIVGAGYLQVPRALYESVPWEQWNVLLNPNANSLTRLGAALQYVTDYVLRSEEAGKLTFYIPAPNPPSFADAAGKPLQPSQLLNGIMQFDTRNLRVGSLYPLEQSFLAGEVNGKILGLSILKARIEALPADASLGRPESVLQVTSEGPTEGWLKEFIPTANLIFEMRQAPPKTIEQWASELVGIEARLRSQMAAGMSDAAAVAAVESLLQGLDNNLPKVKLESAIALRIPPALSRLIQLEADSSAQLVAYSPQYDPTAPSGGPLAEAKRRGGIALRANLKFGNLFSVPNAELSVLPAANGLPALAGRFGPTTAVLPGGAGLRNVLIDFDSSVPSLAASGQMSPIDLGPAFRIVPLSGNDLSVSLQLAGGASSSFKLNPAKLSFNSMFTGDLAIRLHGATRNDSFTFSTDSPWSANLSLEGTDPIELQFAGEKVLRLARSSLQSASISRDEQGVIRLNLAIRGSSTLTAFPGKDFVQTFSLSSDTVLSVDSFGRFNFDAAINDQAGLGATLKGRVTLTNDPDLRFSLGGSVTLPPLVGIRIVPQGTGLPTVASTTVGGSLVIQRKDSALQATLQIKPARLFLETALGASQSFRIDGGSDAQDFTFSTAGPWSARLTLEGSSPFTLQVPGTPLVPGMTVLSIQRNNLSSAAIARDIQNVLRLTVNIAGNSTLTVFPDMGFKQTFTTASSTAVNLNSDGTFKLSGTINEDLLPIGLPGLSISTVKAGASFTITHNDLVADGQLNGGVLSQLGGPSFNATGHFSLTRGGVPTVATDSQLSFPALGTPFLAIEGANGGPITAALGSKGLNLSGARLVVPGLFTNSVPPFSMDPLGDFDFPVGPNTVGFGNLTFGQLQYKLRRANGVLSLTNLTAVLGIPPLTSLNLTGHVASSGLVDLRGSKKDGTLGGYPIASLDVGLRRGGGGGVRSAILASNPLAYWRMGEGSKTPVFAVSETTKAGNVNGTYQPGVTLGEPGALPGDANTSVRFSGNGGHVIVANEQSFDVIGSAVTIEAWIKVNAFDRTWNTIIAKGDSSWRLQRFGNTDTLSFDTDGINPPYLNGNRSVNDGRWHHVVASYNGRVKTIWIDGELDAWVPASGTIAQNDFPVVIGENAQSQKRYWNGWIDEVAVYTQALTPLDILNHRQASGTLVASLDLRAQLPGLDAITLNGSLGSDGSLALLAQPPTLGLGGFALTDSRLQLFRSTGGAASLLTDGNLSFFGLPPIKLLGGVSTAGVLTLSGSLPNGGVLGFNLTDVTCQLSGTTTAGSLGVAGNLGVSGLGALNFSGLASSNGDIALTNKVSTSTPLFGFPADNWQFVLRHEGRNYRTLVSGDPQIPSDRGGDPIAFWRLNESSGTSASDSKQGSTFSKIAGTYVGGVTLGQSGAFTVDNNRAASFDGVNDYVEIANEAAFDGLTTGLSVEAWVKTAGWSKTWEAIVTKGDSSWRLSRYSNTRQVSFDTTSADGSHSLPGSRVIDDNQWHHVVGVYDGVAKYLYVDGILEGFTPYRRTLSQNNSPVRIGENAEATGRYFRGSMDEVAIYRRALSPLEVLDHFRAGGGSGLDVAIRLRLPGLEQLGGVDVRGVLQPSGALSVQASAASVPVTGFNLGTAVMAVTRTTSGSVNAVLGGTLSTPIGNVYVAGSLPANGNYALESDASGSLTIGGRTLNISAPAKLSRINGLEVSGSLSYGDFSLGGTAKVSTANIVSFAGTTSGSTPPIAFGLNINTGKPGHPYAWLSWNASASYDGSTQTIKASVSGSFSVEYEVIGGYKTETLSFPTLTLPTDGRITLNPGTFNNITSYSFDLP